VIERILPGCAAVAEAYSDAAEARLFPAELAAVAKAVPSRRREFATVRRCARIALAELGLPAAAIVPGPDREPQWPPGIAGSMTHCDGYRAAALARTCDLVSVGIDAEQDLPLPDGLLGVIARPEEVGMLAALAGLHPLVHWDRLLFSAKESIYKAWYPLARRWLGFEDATLTLDPAGTAFRARLLQPGLVVGGEPLTHLDGRCLTGDGLIVTSVAIPAPAMA
jgi:enterobactin synthetase component D / holo-[acyl-carrier protein] synthase